MTDSQKKLSSARLQQPTHAFVEQFTASVDFDKRLYQHDINGSIAHATMLAANQIITDSVLDGTFNFAHF